MKKVISLLSLCTALLLGACGGGGDEVQPQALAAPAAVLNITGDNAQVSWPAVEHAKAYYHELTKDGVVANSGQVQLTTYNFKLEGTSKYTFRVKALADKTGMWLDSEWSATLSAQLSQLSSPVARVDAATVTNTSATVSWTSVAYAAAYHYQLCEGGSVVREGDVDGIKFELKELKENTAYIFRVKAVASGDRVDSNYSNDVSFKTTQVIKLAAPTDITAVSSGYQAIVSWKAVDGAASYSYELYQGSAQSAQKSGSVTTATVALTSLQPGSYRFRVKAVGKAEDVWVQESEFSADYTFTIDGQALNLGLPNHEIDGVIRAFPGAEGGGMYTTGGRGGKVIHVTNLNDSGSGSLREAINTSGARTIVFDVCGTIQLKSTLEIKNSDVTIAGQTAPGEGITLRDYSVVVKANNVIIRYMRFRMGDAANQENDAIWGRYYENIILDHCSMSWSTDECASFYANKNFTMQWCLIGESLRKSVHGKGDHGYGGIWGGKNASFHHNMLTCHDSRNARIDHPQIYDNYLSTHRGNVDYRNNLINNWGSEVTYGGESGWFNIIGNYYKKGPASTNRAYFVNAYADYTKDGKVYSDAYGQFYIDGNVNPDQAAITADNKKGINWKNGSNWGNYNQYLSAPLPIRKDDVVSCFTSTHTAADAYARILDCAGASLKRDAVDKRLVDDACNGKATYTNGGNGSKNGIIDTQTAVGGWPTLTATSEEVARATTDTDKDNIPDYYEGLLGLDPTKADATAKTLDPQGLYSNFEIYLHFLVKDVTAAQTAGGAYTKLD